jgi:DNA-binding beta-propeller fold protein YncE
MSQCGSGKCRIKIKILLFLVVVALVGCSAQELERIARENEQTPSDTTAGRTPVGSAYAKTDILIPEEIIKGGQRVVQGAAGVFARILVGPDNDVRFISPVAVGGVNNTLYIVDAGNRAVFRYDLITKKIDPIESVGLQFRGDLGNIFVKKDGSFLIVDSVGKKVFYFDEKGVLLNTFADPANLSIPIDVWVDETTQEVYVADGAYSRIVVFNQFGKAIRTIGQRGTGPGKFRAITSMTSGNDGLYVTDRLELPIQVISKEGDFKYAFGERLQTFPTAVAVDQHQLVYVSDKSDNTIRIYENGNLIATVGGGGSAPGRFRLITDLWVNGEFLYVADSNNRRVQVFRIKAPGSLSLPLGM